MFWILKFYELEKSKIRPGVTKPLDLSTTTIIFTKELSSSKPNPIRYYIRQNSLYETKSTLGRGGATL